MARIPVRTRLPFEAWAVAAIVAIVSITSSLLGSLDASVASSLVQVIERPLEMVKASVVRDHRQNL